MLSNYLAAGKRCAVDFESLKLPVSQEVALNILLKINFKVLDVDLLEIARSCIGKSTYRRGSSIHSAPQQFDCSSFTKWLYAQMGIKLPRRSIQQRELGDTVLISELAPGDLVFVTGRVNYFFDDPESGVGHVGIATGEDTIIHAASSRVGVIETDMERFIEKGFRGAKRIIPKETNVLTLAVPDNREVEWSDDIRWIILQNIK
jgi:hypothetical protein